MAGQGLNSNSCSVTMPAMSDHEIQPVVDSWYTITGLKADLLKPWHYPIEALCMTCGKPIMAYNYFSDWVHIERFCVPAEWRVE